MNDRTRSSLIFSKRSDRKLCHRLTLAEAYRAFVSSVVGEYVHKLGAVLSSASAKTVKSERILIRRAALVVVVFAARVKLTVYKIPVPAPLSLVVSKRNSAAVVLNADRVIKIGGNGNYRAVPLLCLVHRV